VIHDAKVVDRIQHGLEAEMRVASFRNPKAYVFKGQQNSAVSAWVCGQCGFMEFYADAPEALRVLKAE
jgi:rubrerythrin